MDFLRNDIMTSLLNQYQDLVPTPTKLPTPTGSPMYGNLLDYYKSFLSGATRQPTIGGFFGNLFDYTRRTTPTAPTKLNSMPSPFNINPLTGGF